MNKKGNIFMVVIMAIALILIGVLAFTFVLGSAIFTNAFGTITDTLTNIPSVNGTANISSASTITFGNINTGLQQLTWISFIIIFGLVLGIFILYFSVKAHPALFFVHVIMSVVAIVFSIFLSRTYETLLNGGGLIGTALGSYTGSSYILLYMPIWVTVVSFVGAIILYSSITKDSEHGDII